MKHAKEISKKRRTAGQGAVAKAVRTENALELVKIIISDERAAEEFFFNTMRPKMEALADSYNRSYGLDIVAEDVAEATYLSCWEDDWAKMRTYKGETSPHAWVARIATQAVHRYLVDEKYIDGTGNAKTGDYRLTVRGIKDDSLRQAIVDMVSIPEQHMVLEMYYVKKYDKASLVKVFGTDDKVNAILSTAETTLIEQLLNTVNPFAELALSTKKPVSPEVRFCPWHDRIDDGDVSENHQEFRDVLTNLYNNEDWDCNAERLINSVVAGLDWTDVQEEVWRERFFKNTPSKILAERYNVRHTWIDNTYSRLNRQFGIALKAWWNAL